MTKNFTEPCFLIGAGQTIKDDFLDHYKVGAPLVAADGGADKLLEWQIIPDTIIGDMDSISNLKEHQRSKIIHIKNQETTDLEKCLLNIEAPLFFAYGFIGSRFDHSLEILHIFLKYPNKNIIFFSEDDAIFLLPQSWKVKLPTGTRVSLYPLSPSKIKTSKGLKYSLNNLKLEQGLQIGTSNEASETTVSIEIENGQVLAIIPKQFTPQLWN